MYRETQAAHTQSEPPSLIAIVTFHLFSLRVLLIPRVTSKSRVGAFLYLPPAFVLPYQGERSTAPLFYPEPLESHLY